MVDCSWVSRIKFLNLKVHFFLLNAGLACLIPYLPNHAKEIGIPPDILDFMFCLLPLVTIVAKLLFGIIADYFDNVKKLLMVLMVAILVPSVLAFSIPPKPNGTHTEIHCTQTGTRLHFRTVTSQHCMYDLMKAKTMKCIMDCTECVEYRVENHTSHLTTGSCLKKILHSTVATLNLETRNDSSHYFNVITLAHNERQMNIFCFWNTSFECTAFCEPLLKECYIPNEKSEHHNYPFWLFVVFCIMCVSFSGVGTSFSDAICFNELEEDAFLYGKQRLWGSVGWGVFSLMTDSNLKVIGLFFMVHVFIYNLVIVNRLKTKKLKTSQNLCKDIFKTLFQFDVIVFMVSVLLIGMCTSLVWSYLYWHLDAGLVIFSVVPTIQCFFGEIPCFFFAGKIISKIGHYNMLTVAFICFGIRLILYSHAYNPWIVLPAEILQGPSYGLFCASLASFANTSALPGTEFTMQSLFGAVFELGIAIGNFLGSFTTQRNGAHFTYYWGGIISCILCFIHGIFGIVVHCLRRKAKPQNEQNVAALQEVEPPTA